MRILLLGAGGFIGSHLAERLVHDSKHDVVAVDIFDDKLQGCGLEASGRYEYRHLNIITDKDAIQELVKEVDVVVDLIAVANPSVYVSSPLEV